MIQFSLFRISVTVQPFFWLVMALFGFMITGGETGGSGLLNVALFIMAAFISILVHELGHALTIKKYKLPTEIVLQGLGGYATYPAGILNRKQNWLVSAAGPAAQIALGIVAFFIYKAMPDTQIKIFGFYLYFFSLLWAIFNCLPIYPLDGGKMLSSILGPKRERGVYITGIVLSVIIGILAYQLTGSFYNVMLAGFLGYTNWQLLQQTR